MIWFWFVIGCDSFQAESSRPVQRFPTREIQVQDKEYTVEFACEDHEAALGLRYRVLQKDEGVIICATSGAVTMKKMKSPISVAFISAQQQILSIHDLELEDSDLALAPYTTWIWEMPKGWFAQNSIQEGMQIDGL